MLSECYCVFLGSERPLVIVTKPITAPVEGADKAAGQEVVRKRRGAGWPAHHEAVVT